MICILLGMPIDKQLENMDIHRLQRSDIGRLRAMSDQMRLSKDTDYFERNFDYQDEGEREVFMAAFDGQDAGYCILNWKPKYALFRKMDIPEIQDLNVLPGFRKRGIGAAIITHCEALAIERGYEVMGIGVGLDSTYGSAQRLYVNGGYVPDGNGICYDRQSVTTGAFKPVDDNLCLMMVKKLRKDQ